MGKVLSFRSRGQENPAFTRSVVAKINAGEFNLSDLHFAIQSLQVIARGIVKKINERDLDLTVLRNRIRDIVGSEALTQGCISLALVSNFEVSKRGSNEDQIFVPPYVSKAETLFISAGNFLRVESDFEAEMYRWAQDVLNIELTK